MIKTFIRMDTLDQIEKARNLPTFAHVVHDEGEGGHVLYWLGWFTENRRGKLFLIPGGYRRTRHENFNDRFRLDVFGVYSRFKEQL